MAEYIERDKLLRDINHYHLSDGKFQHWVEVQPAADVAPVVHGRWRYFHKQNIAVCTECSFERDLDTNFGRAVNCPNCGAKMDGVDDG